MEQHPDKTFYDRISSYYDGIAHANELKAAEEGLRLLNVQAGEQVLEIGYGTGHNLVAFAQAVGGDGHVSGVDVSSGMHDVAAGRLDDFLLTDRVTLEVGAVPPLNYPDARFDVVSLSFTLELFPLDVIPVLLNEIRRVLKPGGRIGVVSMNKPEDLSEEGIMQHTYEWMHRHFPHIVDCQPIPTSRFLRKAGFEINDQVHIDIWGLPVVAAVAS